MGPNLVLGVVRRSSGAASLATPDMLDAHTVSSMLVKALRLRYLGQEIEVLQASLAEKHLNLLKLLAMLGHGIATGKQPPCSLSQTQ